MGRHDVLAPHEAKGVCVTGSLDLYARAQLALISTGYDATGNPEHLTFRLADDPSVLIVLLTASDALACYSVWRDAVPPESRTAVGAVAAHVNSRLSLAALELDLDLGNLSSRCTLPCARLAEVDDATFAALLNDTVIEARQALLLAAPALTAVLAGATVEAASRLLPA